MFGGGMNKKHNPNDDYEVGGAPGDCISSLSWSPKGTANGKTLLATTSWDKTVRVWDVQKQPHPQGNCMQCQAQPLSSVNFDLPVLCSSISRDGKVFAGGCDKQVKCWDLAGGQQPSQVAAHDQPVKGCTWLDDANLLVTGSWDGTVKFWDCRQSNPAGAIQLGGPFVAMDCSTYPMATFMVAREVVVFDLQNRKEIKRMDPHHTIKEQLRCIGNFPDVKGNPGFAAGSIEGRVCIMYLNDRGMSGGNFSFKCHRENSGADVYAVHSISFHPVYGTFATSGANGAYSFWDKDSKQRLKPFHNAYTSIPCGAFNDDGTLYGYAVSYDWSKGAEGVNSQHQHHILIHSVTEAEVKNKQRPKK